MHTHPNSPITSSHEKPAVKAQGGHTYFIRQFVKWFGITSTIALLIAAVDPYVFNTPIQWRPWIFVTSVFWLIAFSAGLFNL
jgi:hypothetical protein